MNDIVPFIYEKLKYFLNTAFSAVLPNFRTKHGMIKNEFCDSNFRRFVLGFHEVADQISK